MKKQKKSFGVGKVIVAMALGLLTIFLSEIFSPTINKASEPYINPEYLQEYNQVQKLVGHTITLKYGTYSDKTKIGLCVFEVEKDDGKLIPPQMDSDNVIMGYGLTGGDKRLSLWLNSTGSICSKGFMKDDKLVVYVYFEAAPKDPIEIERYNKHQLILYAGDGKSKDKAERDLYDRCDNGEYGFKLDDSVPGKSYKVDDSTILSLSYFGCYMESDHTWSSFKVEVETDDGMEILCGDENSIENDYSEGYLIDGGCRKYNYAYTFDNWTFDFTGCDIGKIKAVYLNGKKLSD